jgi:hypothetical protein
MAASLPTTRRLALETVLCAVLVLAVALHAFWRMDYFEEESAHEIMLTDQSRTAYVAKNLVEGRGYTANDLPAYLLDFYDDRGKLDGERWVNADRFPFTAYAIAGLFSVTGVASPMMGILVYNMLWFVAFAAVLYWFANRLWNRYSAMAAVAVMLVHPYTYVFLYSKDSDTLFIAMALVAFFYRYFAGPADRLSRLLYVGFGTMLAWAFLCRPNFGAPLVVVFGVAMIVRWWRLRREIGAGRALASIATREGVAFLVSALWLVPLVMHSMREWNTLFFSANGLYQLPLGTRFAMGTDTWWKYSDPSSTVSLGTVLDQAQSQVVSKFTSSWDATFKNLFSTWAFELILTFVLFAWLRARRGTAVSTVVAGDERAFDRTAFAFAIALLINLAILPLYGPQRTAYRQYLSFGVPLMWLAAGHAIYLLGDLLRPYGRSVMTRLDQYKGVIAIVAVVITVIIAVVGKPSSVASWLFSPVAKVLARFWLPTLIALVALFVKPWRWRHRGAVGFVLALAIIVAVFRPSAEIKRWSLYWFADGEDVWDVLRQRKGIVSSFISPQGEVAWMTDRRHIPAPELPMHLYSFLFEHGVEIEDLYLNNAEEWLAPQEGPWATTAPGFEGYARLQRYEGRLPGYEIVYNEQSVRGFPKYAVPPRRNAASVYRLVDRAAVQQLRHSPTILDVGDPANIVHTAYGFDSYVVMNGRKLVAATDATRKRYVGIPDADRPWESSALTFFVESARTPNAVEIELYVPQRTTLQFYWNLDLFHYTPGGRRSDHQIGKLAVPKPGWYRARLEVPPGLVRDGLNKLGLRATRFQPMIACGSAIPSESCAQMRVIDPLDRTPPTFITAQDPNHAAFIKTSALIGTLRFEYPGDPVPAAAPAPAPVPAPPPAAVPAPAPAPTAP